MQNFIQIAGGLFMVLLVACMGGYVVYQAYVHWKERKGKKKETREYKRGLSGRGKYGSLWNNTKWFGSFLAIPCAPLLLWKFTLPFGPPLWLTDVGTSFIYTLCLGLTFIVVVFLLVYPFIAAQFVWSIKDPNNIKKPSKWVEPWSCAVEEGRAVAVKGGGGNVIWYYMRHGDCDIRMDVETGDLTSWKDRYDIIKREGSSSEIPVPTLWHRFHLSVSGLVFGGFWWYRELHTYELDVVKPKIRPSDGKLELDIRPNQLTDHVRVRPFAWAVIVTIVTEDRYNVTLPFTFELAAVNPDQMMFGRDRWERLFSQRVSHAAIQVGKKISVFDLLGGDADTSRGSIAEQVQQEIATAVEVGIGIKVITTQVPGYLQIADTDVERSALTAEAVAKAQGKATLIKYEAEAKGEADVIERRGKAAATYKDVGVEMSLHQAIETAAAEGGTVFLNLGKGGGDPVAQATLAELQKLTKERE